MGLKMEIKKLWTTHMAMKNLSGTVNNTELKRLSYDMHSKFKSKDKPNYYDRKRYNCFIEYQDNQHMRELANQAFLAVKQYLFDLYEETPDEYKLQIQGWAMIQGWGKHLLPHNHIGHHLAAVYYVEVPPIVESPIPNSGALVLYNPDPINRGWMTKDTKNKDGLINTIKVKTGDLVIFPGYVNHYVNPWFGQADRISIAMNFLVEREMNFEPMLSEDVLYKYK
jgi:hypothetical protein